MMRSRDSTLQKRPAPWVRLALVTGGFSLIAMASSTIAAQLPRGAGSMPGLTVQAVGGIITLVLLAVVMTSTSQGSMTRMLGLAGLRRGLRTLLGVGLAAAGGFAVVIGIALMTGAATMETAALADTVVTVAIVVPVMLIAFVVPEELVFRGYIQHVLGRYLAAMSMIAAQAGLYAAAASLVNWSLNAVLTTFVTGVGLGYLRLFSGGLWGVLGFRVSMTVVVVLMGELNLEFVAATTVWNLVLGAGVFIIALVVGNILRPKQFDGQDEHDQDSKPAQELTQKGILYDVGTSYMPGQHSRPRWRSEVAEEELRVIHEDLHCNSIILFGASPQRLEEAGRIALRQGLYVWLQPRRFDESVPEVLENLAEVAGIAEQLRREFPDRIGMSIGCEVSLLHRGVLPGDLPTRTRWLAVVSALAPPYVGWRLNRVLHKMVDVTRQHFSGPMSYAAGTWESVDWTGFDFIGVNYYTDVMTQPDYRGGLRRLAAYGKPVLVTEFGCCSYEGAQNKGGSGADIMDWSNLSDRRVKGNHIRDERVQAEHLEHQLDIFETEDVHGAFLCMFIEGDCHYSPDPTRDLDMASFGIVRPPSVESGLSADDGHWKPKRAFHALARRYKAHAVDSST